MSRSFYSIFQYGIPFLDATLPDSHLINGTCCICRDDDSKGFEYGTFDQHRLPMIIRSIIIVIE